MRRISLSLALLGAVTAAGCSGGAAPQDAGGARGVAEGTFTVTIQNGQNGNDSLAIAGGYVTSVPSGIDCGVAPHNTCSFDFAAEDAAGNPVTVVLTANAVAPSVFNGWAADCLNDDPSGDLVNTCSLTGKADKYVVALFGAVGDRTAHPSWTDGAVHSQKFFAWAADPVGYEWKCKNCHGQSLLGAAIAPSCAGCHDPANPATHGSMTLHSGEYFQAKLAAAAPANGPALTTVCLECHAGQATDFMATQHWSWAGQTPELYALADFQATGTPQNPGNIGKSNLINNFCVAIAGNERRCDQCHAGYGDGTNNVSARSGALATNPARVDCLICHTSKIQGNMAGSASPTLAEGALYNKVAGAFGAAGYAVGPGASVASSAQLQYFAQNIQAPTRENCGYCHFNGGGADSVKIMGTQLRTPAVATDVHMSPGGADMSCADCHSAGNHAIKGAGIHTPTNTARAACSDCHTDAPHASSALNGHTATIACQTCHIPALSRAMPQKTDWDWSTAGAKQLGTVYACVLGTVESPYDGSNCSTIPGSAKVKKYDFMKGTFAWGQNVPPVYRWYNGTMTHVTTADKGAFTIETGLTPDSRITLSSPIGARGNGKIFPFKVMTGRQAVYVDGASSFIIAPNLFHDPSDVPVADGGFWGVLSAQPPSTTHTYTYDDDLLTAGAQAPALDAFGAPLAPLTGQFQVSVAFGGYPANTDTPFETLLARVFTRGATLGGQYSGEQMVKFDGTNPGWDWRYTKMFLDLEHEVAPAAQAIGAAGCTECHGAAPAIPICELYAGATELPWGVTCP